MVSFYPLLPIWLIILLVILSAAVIYRSHRHRNPVLTPWRHRLLIALHTAALLLVTVMLLCPGSMVEERNLEKSHLVFLVDQSASMRTRDLPNRQSRLEGAVDFLQQHPFKLLKDYPRAIYACNNQVKHHTNTESLTALKASGGTDLKQAVERINGDIGLNRVSAIVLISDGLDYSAFKGSSISVPIMSVRAGTDMKDVPDLAIESFKCPEKVSRGEEILLNIPIIAAGYSREQTCRFTLRVDRQLIRAVDVTLAGGRPHIEKVSIPFNETGLHIIDMSCGELPEEASLLNNRRGIAVEVVKAKEEVATYFPLLNNSLRPLLREFTKDDNTAFTLVYKVNEGNFRLRGIRVNQAFKNGLPVKPDALRHVTCMILGSNNANLISPGEALILEHYVAKGGTLICLGGTDSFGQLPADSIMGRLLPVIPMERSYVTGSFQVEPETLDNQTFTAQIHEIISENVGDPDFFLDGVNVVKGVKANAKVLLWAVGDHRLPLLVYQPYGRGKVVALLTNALHQWGAPEKRDENFGRFWRQLVAFSRNPDEDTDLLKVALSTTEPAVGEPVTLTAVARKDTVNDNTSDPPLTVKADLFADDHDAPLRTLDMEKKSGHYAGVIPGLKPGRYMVRVTSQKGGKMVRTRYKFLLVGDVMLERTRTRCDRENFRAVSSEGRIFELGEAKRLQDQLLETLRRHIVQRERFLIFETPCFFLGVSLLLLAEWLLRRRFNLF